MNRAFAVGRSSGRSTRTTHDPPVPAGRRVNPSRRLRALDLPHRLDGWAPTRIDATPPAGRQRWPQASGAPGDAAQGDLWFPPKRIPLEDGTTALLPVLVMVPAHSRFICGRMIPLRRTEDLLLASWSVIEGLGRVPRRLIWDNETGIGRRGRLATGVAEFCGTLATRVRQLKARDPESKGVVERRNGFFETCKTSIKVTRSPWPASAHVMHPTAAGSRPIRVGTGFS